MLSQISDYKLTVLYILIFSHFVSDYLFQPRSMILKKWENPSFVFVHGLVVFLVNLVAIFYFFDKKWLWGIVVLSFTHVAVDLLKIEISKNLKHRKLELGIADQLLHFILIVLIWLACIEQRRHGAVFSVIFPEKTKEILLYLTGTIFIFKPARSYVRGILEKVPLGISAKNYLKKTKYYSFIGNIERFLFFVLVLIDKWLILGFIVLGRILLLEKNQDKKIPKEYLLIQILADLIVSIFAGLVVNFLVNR